MLRPDTFIAIHSAATAAAGVALCAAVLMGDAAEAPEWVHLLPAGTIATGDGRGPYRVADAAELIRVSLQAGDRLPIDENHATDLAAPRGEPAPARGWIVALEARADGVWGKVEWTAAGRRLVAGRSYRGISPVIQHLKDGTVQQLLRASLVNRPNLRGLAALHQENNMDFLAKLLAALGLPATTTEDAAITAVTALHQAQLSSSTSLQAARSEVLAPIAKAVGLAETADAAAVLAGVQQIKGNGDGAVITALQGELVTLATELKTLKDNGAKDRATTFVDQAIAAHRVGIKPMRDRYISMHMADPAGTEQLINAMPTLGGGGNVIPNAPPPKDGEIALNAEQLATARILGVDPKAYAETMKAERQAAL